MRLLPRRKTTTSEPALPGMPAISAHLTLEKFLNLAPLDASDAIGVRHKGRVYKFTGRRGTDFDHAGRLVMKARARAVDTRDEVDVVQWYVTTPATACLVAPPDVHLIYPPTAAEQAQYDGGRGWREFR